MDIKKILLEQRNLNLKKYGIDISYEQSDLSDYKYTIKNGDFAVYVYRDNKDEIDTLSQIITYLDSAPHKIALAEAGAIKKCKDICEGELLHGGKKTSMAYLEMVNLLSNAKKVDLEKELDDLGIVNINSFHCTNVLGLEDTKPKLAELYMSLVWLKQTAEQQSLNYETAIFEAENGLQKI